MYNELSYYQKIRKQFKNPSTDNLEFFKYCNNYTVICWLWWDICRVLNRTEYIK